MCHRDLVVKREKELNILWVEEVNRQWNRRKLLVERKAKNRIKSRKIVISTDGREGVFSLSRKF